MNLESAMAGAIMIAICIVPFISMSRGRKKRDKQMLLSLTEIAKQHDCQISQHEFCGDFVIGIDEIKNFIFFHKHLKNRVIEQFIDLANIKNCKVINLSRSIKTEEGIQKVIDKLELAFIPTSKDKSEITLEFFNSDVTTQLYGEFPTIEKWSKHINDRLKLNKQ
jgi:hypothetical protein